MMTKKRRNAIRCYVLYKTSNQPYLSHVIELTIDATNMDRELLYSKLRRAGYRYRNGIWSVKSK